MNLGSGKRANTARDDAAGLPIVDAMTSQIDGLTQASRNAADGISLFQTTEGAEAQMVDNLQRIYTLTVQGLNGTNSATGIASLQAEIDQRLEEIDRIARETQFNGLYPLATDGLKVAYQIGANAGDTVTVSLEKLNTSTLGIKDFKLSDPRPLTTLAEAIDQVDGSRGSLGAMQNRFDSIMTNLDNTVINLSAARSRIQDADYAQETANLNLYQTLQKSGMQALRVANSSPQNILVLLNALN